MFLKPSRSMSVYFLFYKNTEYDYIYGPSQKINWLSLGTLLKVLFATSGVFSWFSHVAGNIYFALLPVVEDAAALHVFFPDCHCATHLAAAAQSTFQISFGVRQTLMALHSPIHVQLLVTYFPQMWISSVHNVQNAILSWNAQLHCSVVLNFLDKRNTLMCMYIYCII